MIRETDFDFRLPSDRNFRFSNVKNYSSASVSFKTIKEPPPPEPTPSNEPITTPTE